MKLTGRILKSTYRVVKRDTIKQLDHIAFVFRSYVNRNGDAIDISDATVSHWCCGVTQPPWELIVFYADAGGTRCPERLVSDLGDYIADCYRSRRERDGLRAALMGFLEGLPPEDAQDIQDYWRQDDLADMWAVLLWYAMCCDYSAKFWAA